MSLLWGGRSFGQTVESGVLSLLYHAVYVIYVSIRSLGNVRS